MSEPVKHIIGILIEFEDEATGVPSSLVMFEPSTR